MYPKKPELLKISLLSPPNLLKSEIDLETNFTFNNPNYLNLTLKSHDIDVYVNDKMIGHFSQTESRAIPAKEVFTIPINIQFKRSKIFGDTGFLKNILKTTLDQKLIVRYEGTVDLAFLGLDIPFDINYSKNILESDK